MRYPEFVRHASKILMIAGLAAACDSGPSVPRADSLAITATSPPEGTTIVVPEQYPYIVPGGVALLPGSGLLSARVTMTAAHDVPWAQLNVYLLTGGTMT